MSLQAFMRVLVHCVNYHEVVSWCFICGASHDKDQYNAGTNFLSGFPLLVVVSFPQGQTYLSLKFFHIFVYSVISIPIVSAISLQEPADIIESLHWCYDFYSCIVIVADYVNPTCSYISTFLQGTVADLFLLEGSSFTTLLLSVCK